MQEKMYLLIFVFLGLVNIAAFFVYKSRLETHAKERYNFLASELDKVLKDGDKKLQALLAQITNDCNQVINDYKSQISSLPLSSFPSSSVTNSTSELKDRELDYYWFVSCGVPFVTIGREHFTVGDILPTGERISRINDYCIRTDEGIIIYNTNCRRNSFVKNEGVQDVRRVD